MYVYRKIFVNIIVSFLNLSLAQRNFSYYYNFIISTNPFNLFKEKRILRKEHALQS